jgi:hypothetical protein
MKITLKEGKLYIDSVEMAISKLTTAFLDNILELAIQGKIEYELMDNGHPVYDFFNNLQIDTMIDSDFMKEISKLEQEKKVAEEKLKAKEESL